MAPEGYRFLTTPSLRSTQRLLRTRRSLPAALLHERRPYPAPCPALPAVLRERFTSPIASTPSISCRGLSSQKESRQLSLSWKALAYPCRDRGTWLVLCPGSQIGQLLNSPHSPILASDRSNSIEIKVTATNSPSPMAGLALAQFLVSRPDPAVGTRTELRPDCAPECVDSVAAHL